MKGFLQTTYTHGRAPCLALRRLGAVGMLCAFALVPGTVLSALAYPFLIGLAVWRFATGDLTELDPLAALAFGSGCAVLAAGIVALVLPALVGCVRRRWWNLLPLLPLLPLLYAPAASLAAWASLLEIALAPTRWNKTDHGLARTSRSGLLMEDEVALDSGET